MRERRGTEREGGREEMEREGRGDGVSSADNQ